MMDGTLSSPIQDRKCEGHDTYQPILDYIYTLFLGFPTSQLLRPSPSDNFCPWYPLLLITPYITSTLRSSASRTEDPYNYYHSTL